MLPWLGPPLTTVLCTSGFVDDVIYSYNGAKAQWTRIEDDAYVSLGSPGGAPGSKLLSLTAGLLK